jgi:hypothetical protein
MEQENIEVKAVDGIESTTAQQKEAAVIEQAVEQGEVSPDYGFQDDGTYKVNLDKPVNTEENAIQESSPEEVSLRNEPEFSGEVQQENEQEPNEELAEQSNEQGSPLELISDETPPTPESIEEKIVEAVEEAEEKNIEMPEDIQKLVSFMDETGGSLEDYVSLNRDFSALEPTSLVYEYLKATKPHLDDADISFMMQNKFGFDEDVADESEAKAKQLAFKEDLYKAQSHFNTSKEKYYADLKLRKQSNVPEEYKEAFDFYKQAKESESINNQNSEFFQQATNKVFNEEFKGFDFKVGDKKYRFKVENSNKVRDRQSDLTNFVSDFLDEKTGKITKPLEYHRALFAAENVDKIANHFYEQGRADALKNSAKQSKNIDMSPRQDAASQNQYSNSPVKVVSSNSSDKLRIKWK